MRAGFHGIFTPGRLNRLSLANRCCKPLPGEISVQNIPHGPVYLAGFAGYITLGCTESRAMERKTAEAIFAACEQALSSLTEAEGAISQISDPAERRELMHSLAKSIAEILGGVRAPAMIQYPDIQPPEPRGEPDTALEAEDLVFVSQLTTDDIALIDSALLAECAATWRKVARVVGYALNALRPKFEELPYGYLALRVVALAEAGKIVFQGDLHYIRSSEVRLNGSTAGAA
jgi:hypothetical protein